MKKKNVLNKMLIVVVLSLLSSYTVVQSAEFGKIIEAESSDVTRSGGSGSTDHEIVTSSHAEQGARTVGASGGAFVRNIWRGHLLSFTVTVEAAGTYDLHIRYVGNSERGGNVIVNGDGGTDYTFDQTSSWNFTDALIKKIPITLTAGENTIGFRGPQSGNEWAVEVDYFAVTEVGEEPGTGGSEPGGGVALDQKIEAEGDDVTRSGGSGGGDLKIINSGGEEAGASGGAFLSGIWRGHLVSFKIDIEKAGNYMLHIRYVGNSERGGNLIVNGDGGTDYTFDQTSSWNFTDALIKQIPITLVAGENTIGFRGPQSGSNEWAVNVDYFMVEDLGEYTGLGEFASESASVVAQNQGILIKTNSAVAYQVVNMQGQVVSRGIADKDTALPLQSGVYLVQVNGNVCKLMVK